MGVSSEAIKSKSRARRICDARQVFCIVANNIGYTTLDLSAYLQQSRCTVSTAINKDSRYVSDFIREVEEKIDAYNNELVVNCIATKVPTYGTEYSAGADLYSTETKTIAPHSSETFSTGFKLELPANHVAFVKGRSGLMFRNGVIAGDGTIDADYRGEVKVFLHNLTDTPYEVKFGERIAQLVVLRYVQCNFNQVEELTTTYRGEGGFGHTGR